MIDDSAVSEHRVIPMNSCCCSFEADLLLGSIEDADDNGSILLIERDQKNCLGVEIGER